MSELNSNNLNQNQSGEPYGQGPQYTGMSYQSTSPYDDSPSMGNGPYSNPNLYNQNSNQNTNSRSPYEHNAAARPSGNNPSKVNRSKTKKKDSFGKKIGTAAVVAAVFGLVAGGVFQGVDLATNKLKFKSSQTQELENEDKDTSASEKEKDKAESSSEKAKSSDDKINDQVTVTNGGGETLQYDVASIVEAAQPSIVSITTAATVTQEYFFTSYSTPTTGAGSGIIIDQYDENLYLVTNHHVIEHAEEIKVGFNDSETVNATVKGYDVNADIAVLIVKKSDMKDSTKKAISVASIGNSDNLKVGQPSIAIGNALGYGQSVTVGYISALDRTIEDAEGTFIQTDAAINPGNSGGALIDSNGNVIGINSVKYVDSTVEGMGFSIPINKAMTIVNDIIEGNPNGAVYLGISGADISNEYSQIYGFPMGVYIKEITEFSPASDAGLHVGDIIVAFDKEEVYTVEDLQNHIRQCKDGQEVELEVYRADSFGNYEKSTMTVTLRTEN